jgi:hypothetical protein
MEAAIYTRKPKLGVQLLGIGGKRRTEAKYMKIYCFAPKKSGSQIGYRQDLAENGAIDSENNSP